MRKALRDLGIKTVCQSARCPNIHECFSKNKCTFLILGGVCTRQCGFCAVEKRAVFLKGPDKKELYNIKEAIEKSGIRNIVVTSVTRDDLGDGGAEHFADCINILRGIGAALNIEVLVPDFLGNKDSVRKVVSAGPDIFSHNMETVPRLYDTVRPQADYKRSLDVLARAKEISGGVVTKSGLMVGLGEFEEEICASMKDLRSAGCDVITIGQYLKPGPGCLEVEEFLRPEQFEKFSEWAREMGFKEYFCGPFVRSSYN